MTTQTPIIYDPSLDTAFGKELSMNAFYHGDCLFVMAHDIIANSVDLIYLDPPFFTGKIQKGVWKPGAMEVSYEDSRQFWSDKETDMRQSAPPWLKHMT